VTIADRLWVQHETLQVIDGSQIDLADEPVTRLPEYLAFLRSEIARLQAEITAQVDPYIAAAMVACPRCKAAIGKPCIERACRHGYRDCQYAICSYWAEQPTPHLERAVHARQEASTP